MLQTFLSLRLDLMIKKYRMKYKIILLPIIFILFSSISNYKKDINDEEDRIFWSNNRKLTWDDFKGIPDTIGKSNLILTTVAETSSGISLENSNTNNSKNQYKIESIFLKNKSWTITNSLQILAHEQLHFDLTELYARKIRKAFDSLKIRKNFIEENYIKIYNSNIKQLNDINDRYDNETYGNEMNQNKWIKKVDRELLKLKKYEYISAE